MDKLSKSLEFLKLLSKTTSELIIKSNDENYFKLIKASMETLFTTCDENDYNISLTAEEKFKEAVLTRIQVELHGIIKHNPNVESKALKGVQWRFAKLAN
ncbi:unnamed protein product, partial [Rotaria sordida]